MVKSNKELESINTKNLLRYFKAERKRFFSFKAQHTCYCGCGEMSWDLRRKDEALSKYDNKNKNQYESYQKYLDKIKDVLNKREHIQN